MEPNDLGQSTNRRGFIGTIATGAAALGAAALVNPLQLQATPISSSTPLADNPEEVFSKIKGKHRVVFDATRPHELMPFAWPRVFLLTNEKTGTAEKDNSVVVVLRHDAIPYAFEDRIWEKYKFGEVFKAEDPRTKQPSLRNPFAKPDAGEFKIPGVGPVNIGINELQQSGVIFVVCDMAMTVYSHALAEGMKMDGDEIKKEWISGLLPGITPVPSGVWALGRAQEKGCAYVFAG